MAVQTPGLELSFPANGDLSNDQFKCFKFDGNGQLDLCDTQGEPVDGILQDTPSAQGRSGNLAIDGRLKAICNSALTAGTFATVGSDGLIEVAASGDYILGRILSDTSATGQLVEILVNRPGRVA